MSEHPIIIIGAGPACLMAAQKLAEAGFKVEVYEQNKAAARKFLVAGHGGFNLTHAEDISSFIEKYNRPQIQEIVQFFDNKQTIAWLQDLDIDTYIGSSGKIFPAKHIKPIQVLQAWLKRLEKLGVQIFYNQKFTDFTDTEVIINQKRKPYSRLILGLGGGSWAKTGSDASWVDIFKGKGIRVVPLAAANSGYNTCSNYSELEGQYLKNIRVHFKNISRQGEIVFSSYGIEGAPLYYMNRYTRKEDFPLEITLDLKPHISISEIISMLQQGKPITEILKNKLKLSSVALHLIKRLEKQVFTDPIQLAHHIKAFPILVESFRPIDEVISTAGGLSFESLNAQLALHAFPQVYAIGEMLDWEAPTGGYLLQACFSTGAWVAHHISKS